MRTKTTEDRVAKAVLLVQKPVRDTPGARNNDSYQRALLAAFDAFYLEEDRYFS